MAKTRPLRLADHSIAGQRDHNEDSVLVLPLSDDRTLIAVADGMGGHASGEVASALAVESLAEAVRGGQSLADGVRLANTRVWNKARSDPAFRGMGTTLVAMLREGDRFEIANVGDSRAYLVTRDGIRQLSEDHSFVAEAMRRGQSEEEARASRWKDALTRSIGNDAQVVVDLFGPFPVDTDMAVLLCSDGLFKTLPDSELRERFRRSGGPLEAARALVQAAFEDGSDDNISVVVAEFGEVPRAAARSSTATLVMDAPFAPPEEPAAPTPAAAPPPEAAPPERSGRSWWPFGRAR